MMISTKGRYALRVMVDLAEHGDSGYIPMKEVAQRQEISLKYLEKILPLLVAGKLVEGIHGKGGGYRLTRSPGEYTIGEILRLTEGSIAPIACLDASPISCEKMSSCITLPFWKGLNKVINDYVDGVTLQDLLDQHRECGIDNYQI